MKRKFRVGDSVSFRFAGEPLEGEILEFYENGTKVMVQGFSKKYKYPIEVKLLTKIK